MMKLHFTSFCLLLALAFTSLSAPAQANMTALGHTGTTTINAHGVCRQVTNNSGLTIMIPWRTSAEWASFYNRSHSGVTVATCGCPAQYVPMQGCGANAPALNVGASIVLSCVGGGYSCNGNFWCPTPNGTLAYTWLNCNPTSSGR